MSLSTLFLNSYIFRQLISTSTFASILDSTGDDQGLSVTCDSDGNVYFSGYYTGTPSIFTQFGGTLDILPASTTLAAFVCKFDSSGVYKYSRIVDTAGADQGNGVTCDTSGNMYISGYYSGTPTIKDQTGASLGTLPLSTSSAVFVCKFNSSGTYQYSRIVDSAGFDAGQGVACDSSNNVYVAGRYAGTPTIKDQSGTSLATLPASSVDAGFLCKFNSSGTYQYARIVDGTGTELGYSATCDSSGNVYLGGYYVTAAPSVKDQTGASLASAVAPVTATLPTPSGECAFVSKFDSSGVYQYSRIVDGTGSERIFNIACDSSGNLYVAGYYGAGAATVKNQGGATLTAVVAPLVATLPAGTGNIAFVSKFDSSGTYQYSRIVESTGNELAYGVGCDSSNNMYLTGQYTGTTVVKDQGNTTLATLPVPTGYAGFLCKFNSSGTYQDIRLVDASSDDRGYGIASDSKGNIYFTGYYNGTSPYIKNNVGALIGTLPASLTNSAFLCKFDSSFNYSPVAQTYPTFARIIDSAGVDQGQGVACDTTGNMYLAGYYNGTPSIKDQYGGTTFGTLPVSVGVGNSAFVSKFNSAGTYQYSRVVDGTSNEQGTGVACDTSGNMYLAGYYTGTPTVKDQGGGSLTAAIAPLVSTLVTSAGFAAFVSKFNSTGTYQYSRIIDSGSADLGLGVACDTSGNMYISGYYSGTPTVKDQGGNALTAAIAPLVSTLVTSTGFAAFVSKFNSAGTYQYSRVVDGTSNEQGTGVACDTSGNMYLTGYYSGTPTVKDQGGNALTATIAPFVSTLVTAAGSTIFVSKFNSTGTYQYSRVVDGTTTDQGLGVACDTSDNVYITGFYTGTATIKDQGGTSLGTLPATSGATNAAFVSKFNSTGTYQYSRVLDSTGNDQGLGVTCDTSGNMYLTGLYNGTPTIYNQSGTSLGTLPLSSGAAAFVCKFDSSGAYKYSRIVDSTTNADQGNGVTCDSSGNMYLTGFYSGTPTIKNEVGSSLGTLPASASNAAFVCKFNSDGTYYPPQVTFSRIIDAANADIGYGVACDVANSVFLAGYYNGTPTIKNQAGTSLGTLPASSAGINTGFFSKFDQLGTYSFSRILSSTTGTIFITSVACDIGSNIYAMGFYNTSATIRNQAGTSLGTLPNLGDSVCLMKFDTAGTYQWTRIVSGPPIWPGLQCDVDSMNNVYMCGYYNASGGIYTQAGTFIDSLVGASSIAAFTVKFDTAGTLLYSLNFDSPSSDGVFAVASDSSSDIGIAGGANGACTIVKRTGGVNVTLGTLPSTQSDGGFVSRFDSSGNLRHSFVIDTVGGDNCTYVAFDSKRNMYVLGNYTTDPASIKDQTGATVGTLPVISGTGSFVCKFDYSGTYKYSFILDSGVRQGQGIACDTSDNMYFSGYYNGASTTIKDQTGTSLATLPTSSGAAAFVCKFDSSGTYKYSKIVDSTGNDDAGYGVSCDSVGTMYLAGYYIGTPTIKDQSGTLLGTLPASASNAAFVCRFNSDGTYTV